MSSSVLSKRGGDGVIKSRDSGRDGPAGCARGQVHLDRRAHAPARTGAKAMARSVVGSMVRSVSLGRGCGVAAGAVVLAAGLVGCQSGNEAEMNALLAENVELRETTNDLRAALAEANEAFEIVSAENDDLNAENQNLRSQLAAARATPAPAATGTTGFEGMGRDVFRRPGELVVEVAGDVLFASGSVDLRDASKRELERIARVIRERYPSNQIRISGYTDTDPIRKSDWETNERLSSERALAVEEFLAEQGIDKDRMYSAAFGPADQKSSKQESRRVEIVILAPDS